MKYTITTILLSVLLIASIGALGFVYMRYKGARQFLAEATAAANSKEQGFAAKEAEKESLIKQKDTYISFLEQENSEIKNQLQEEQGKGALFEEQVSVIGKTIAEIQKIQNTDAELLKKYSKIYFLNENYKPEGLTTIPTEYLANQKSTIEIHTKVAPFLLRMLQASSEYASTSPLRVISGFRSFEDQKSLKSNYKVSYGAGANKFSADQGYSEHQLGTTVDLSNVKLGLGYTQMGSSPSLEWLHSHAHDYGFILSYPKGNDHYMYEPWHWRFVGVALATSLHDRGLHFYDIDQREIDSYIGKLFDN